MRDALMGRPVADIDLATAARPEQIEALFERTIPVGRAFGIVVVVTADGQQFEVATFRTEGTYADGRRPDAITYADSVQEDVQRRDFTINALVRHPLTGVVVDHVGGIADLRAGIVRTVGDPRRRFHEDRLRVLRAVRFAALFDFAIEAETRAALGGVALESLSKERVWQEFGKATARPGAGRWIALIQELGLRPWPGLERTWSAAAFERAVGASLAVRLAVLLGDVDAVWLRAQPLAAQDVALCRWLVAHRRLPTDAVGLRRLARDARGADLRRYLQALDPADPALESFEAATAWIADHPTPRLLSGDELKHLGVAHGAAVGRMLMAIDEAQLSGTVATRAEAETLVLALTGAPGAQDAALLPPCPGPDAVGA